MKPLKLLAFVFVLVMFTDTFFTVEDIMALEKAKYTVLEKQKDFELRQYVPHIVAETIVEGDFEQVGNEGFRRLFDYISGKNRKKQSISMTAPVSQEAESEKISMTAPVNMEKLGEKYRITFLMPTEYTMETLPEPLDTRVQLKEVPGRLVAAFRYSGTWSRSRYEDKKVQLQELLDSNGLRPAGTPIFCEIQPAFYALVFAPQ